MPNPDVPSQNSRKQMELQAEFLIKSVEEIETTNRQLRGGKRKQLETDPSMNDSSTASAVIVQTKSSHHTSLPPLRSHRALADDLSSCAGAPSFLPSTKDRTIVDADAAERLKEIQSNAELKIRILLHRVSHLEEQLALSQADNERLKQAFILKPSRRQQEDADDPTQQYLNKLLVQQRSLLQENAKLKRELLSTCPECRARTATKDQPPSPVRRPTFQSSARHVLENLPRQQRKNSLQQRRTWPTPPQS